MSKSSSIGDGPNASSALDSSVKNTQTLSAKSKYAIVAFIISGVAGIVLIALGITNMFGSIGSLGFIASTAGGGTLVCVAIGGVLLIAVSNCKNQKQLSESEKMSTPPSGKKGHVDTTAPAKSTGISESAGNIDPIQLLNISSEKKKNIVDGRLSQKAVKDEYGALKKGRNIPELCGFNQWSPENFNLLTPGIAAIATLLSDKHKLRNLWVCRNLSILQNRLQEIQSLPQDQRHAFIVPTHSSKYSIGHKKTENWEQHIVAICVEKVEGNMHIYLLESMVAYGNEIITQDQINLDEQKPFTEQELMLAFIDAAKLDRDTTSVYTSAIRREFAGGCSTFALRDALYFLRDRQFTKKLVFAKSRASTVADTSITLPNTRIDLQMITALPPQCMQLTQSISTVEKYQKEYPDIANQAFGSDGNKTLSQNLAKSTVINPVANRRENHRIARAVLKYQCVILELLKCATDSEIQSLIGQTLI